MTTVTDIKAAKTCSKCGSADHKRPTHHKCPFYKKSVGAMFDLFDHFHNGTGGVDADMLHNSYKNGNPNWTGKCTAKNTGVYISQSDEVETNKQDKFFNDDIDTLIKNSDIPYPSRNWIEKQLLIDKSTAYKSLAKRWHPDSFMNKYSNNLDKTDEQILINVTATFQLISELYQKS